MKRCLDVILPDNKSNVMAVASGLLLCSCILQVHAQSSWQGQATVTAITSQPTSIPAGSTINVTSSVTSPNGVAPSGTLVLYDGSAAVVSQTVTGTAAWNLLPYSASSLSWLVTGSAVKGPLSEPGLDGSTSGFTIQYPGTSDGSVTQSILLYNTAKYMFSTWLRTNAGSVSTVISMSDQNGRSYQKNVVLTNAWRQFIVVGDFNADTSPATVILAIGGSGTLGPSIPAGSINVWHTQLEQSTVGPYVPTTGSSVTSGRITNLISCSHDAYCGGWWPQGDGSTGDFYDAGLIDLDPEGYPDTLQYWWDGSEGAKNYLAIDLGPQIGNSKYTFSLWLKAEADEPEVDAFLGLAENVRPDGSAPVISTPVHISHDWHRFTVGGQLSGQGNLIGTLTSDTFIHTYQGFIEFWGGQIEQGTTTSGPYLSTAGGIQSRTYANYVTNSNAASLWSMVGPGGITSSAVIDPYGTTSALDVASSQIQNTALVQVVPVADLTQPYRFSTWLRVPSGTLSSSLSLSDQNGVQASTPISITTDWNRFDVVGYLSEGATQLSIGVGQANSSQCTPITCTDGVMNMFGTQVEMVQPGPFVATTDVTTDQSSLGSVSSASFAISNVSVGTHWLRASYSGDGYSNPSSSSPVRFDVLPSNIQLSSLILSCLPVVITAGQDLVCNATLSGATTGSVAFTIDGTPWMSSTLSGTGVASAIQQNVTLSPGVHQILAIYNSSISASSNLVVVSPGGTLPSAELVYSYSIPESGFDGAGNVINYTDSINGNWAASYDNLNRLTSAAAILPDGAQGYLCWGYDSFGNRLYQAVSSAPCTPATQPTSSAQYNQNNQIIYASNAVTSMGYTYDAAGNVTSDGANHFYYDAAGHMCAMMSGGMYGVNVSLTGYLYDADGKRVAKTNIPYPTPGGVCDNSTNNSVVQAETVYGIDGSKVLVGQLNPSTETLINTTSYLYATGKLIATQDQVGLHYQHSDWLGTRRVQTDEAGNSQKTITNFPYGDSLQSSNATDIVSEGFTGKDLDAESGLNYFGTRYYISTMGRFMSPDSSGLTYADISNPQSFNLYTYAWNNPMTNNDPSGLSCVKGTVVENGIPREVDSDDGDGKGCDAAGIAADGSETKRTVYQYNYDAGGNYLSVQVEKSSSYDMVGYLGSAAAANFSARMAKLNGKATPAQYIRAIANAAPTICGGGVFGYRTREVDLGVANGAGGAIVEADSRSGVSGGTIVEAGVGQGYQGGAGAITTPEGTTALLYGGVGVHSPVITAAAGGVGFTSGVGVYGEVGVGGQVVGGGAYMNVTTNQACLAKP